MEGWSWPDDVKADWARGISGSAVRGDRVVHVEHVWGTAISIIMAGTRDRWDAAQDVIETCQAWFADVDRIFSTYREDSQVTAARRGRGTSFGSAFEEVADTCARLRLETDGAFDPWSVPGGYDPSAYVKGWAADQALGMITAAGFADVLVNAGGDVCARGDEAPGSGAGWPVGIVNPFNASELIDVVHLHDSAIATSGRYERGAHVIDPGSGDVALAVDSASVVGPDLGVADALATAALVRGFGASAWVAARGRAWSLHLVVNGVVYVHGEAFDEDPEPPEQRDPSGRVE